MTMFYFIWQSFQYNDLHTKGSEEYRASLVYFKIGTYFAYNGSFSTLTGVDFNTGSTYSDD